MQRALAHIRLSEIARVAEQADARDLKSCVPKGTCGFDPHPGHFSKWRVATGDRRVVSEDHKEIPSPPFALTTPFLARTTLPALADSAS